MRRVLCWLGFHEPRGLSLPGGSTVLFRCRRCGASCGRARI